MTNGDGPKRCGAPGIFQFRWPGKSHDHPVCAGHGVYLVHVALSISAFGFRIELVSDGESCDQVVK